MTRVLGVKGEKMGAEKEQLEARIEMYAKWPRKKLFRLVMDLLEDAKVWPPSPKETNFWRLNRISLATMAVALGA